RNNFNLRHVGDLAFAGIKDFHVLDLSRSMITYLPTEGLIDIRELVIEETPSLKQFPSVFKFSQIETARLTYKHHCCAFRHPDKQDPAESSLLELTGRTSACAAQNQMITPSTASQPDTSPTFGPTGVFRIRRASRGSILSSTPNSHNDTKWVTCGNFSSPKNYSRVMCTPQPNAFNPCEDLMGYEWLRVFVWFVLLAALGGNLIVIIVLLTARSKLTVPKFLMCNLSFADFLMGLYLLLIASVDVHFLGEYFTHAVSWQNDGGCQVAGFLTVFASELSVFVLTVITMERWYAISQAIHVNKRLRMRQATGLMFFGWIYASSMALLPLFGVSGYGAVSICLPMEARDVWDIVYIISLLIFNGFAFMVISGCYISMFLKVRASENMARSNDATIAKRMAILVLTNFICWAPIAFFGLTASFGHPLIDITNSKILLVFFYPFNSCANPFLYAILTKQFRKDFFILLGRYGFCTDRANKYK
ncbi:unnamed protein product, partial [Lymnaea stagnalis]